nr:pyridoxamine 5'-phosphate oxidase family protein [Micromonospora sp. DSM 115978]
MDSTSAASTAGPDPVHAPVPVPVPVPISVPRLVPSRHRDRVSDDLVRSYDVLDEARVCHVGTVVDGWPNVVPTLHVRVGDALYLHGSVAARLLMAGRLGAVPLCVTVTLLDALVLARSAFNHSVNYRSVVVRGLATLVTDEAVKRDVLNALVDRSAPNRSAECRPPTRK